MNRPTPVGVKTNKNSPTKKNKWSPPSCPPRQKAQVNLLFVLPVHNPSDWLVPNPQLRVIYLRTIVVVKSILVLINRLWWSPWLDLFRPLVPLTLLGAGPPGLLQQSPALMRVLVTERFALTAVYVRVLHRNPADPLTKRSQPSIREPARIPPRRPIIADPFRAPPIYPPNLASRVDVIVAKVNETVSSNATSPTPTPPGAQPPDKDMTNERPPRIPAEEHKTNIRPRKDPSQTIIRRRHPTCTQETRHVPNETPHRHKKTHPQLKPTTRVTNDAPHHPTDNRVRADLFPDPKVGARTTVPKGGLHLTLEKPEGFHILTL